MTNPNPKRRQFRFSLRALLAVMVLLSFGLALSVRYYRWAHRDVAKIENAIVHGMPLIDAIEKYKQSHGTFPKSLEAAGIHRPFTDHGYFAYAAKDGLAYWLSLYLGKNDGYLRWNDHDRRWVTDGRIPSSLVWTETEARQMLADKGRATSRKSTPKSNLDQP